MKKQITSIMLAIGLIFSAFTFSHAKTNDENLIQMAVLLDSSGSMDGLIEQAKTQLWKIVNELALAKKNGKSPDLEVALYEYGKDSIPAKEGYLRMIVPLTTDLDKVSEELFKITTNGGSEYCGKVIDTASRDLKWSKNNKCLKVIFIAGNEPFTQGKVDYVDACKAAISKGIIVNTIHCGDHQTGINTKWKHGADLADGKYMTIDQNQQIVHISAPQDEEILRLGEELNKTYIPFGSSGATSKKRQEKQDKMAYSVASEVMVQRTLTKSSKQYKNVHWDLVDAEKEGVVDLDKVKTKDLPEEMKSMNKEERKQYVSEKKEKRDELQVKINKLNKNRRQYVENERKKQAQTNTLDQAIINAVQTQAKSKSFKF